MEDSISKNKAWSVLFEVMSQIFSYPKQTIYAAIQSGQLLQLMQECLLIADVDNSLIERIRALNKSLQQQSYHFSYERLESDYISLFELNRNNPPLHMNAHLYGSKPYGQLELQQKLISFYRVNGLEIKALEQADHLCVQLNFIAWLYQEMDTSEQNINKHLATLQTFLKQLTWLQEFARQLEERQHCLYSPMSEILTSLIDESSRTISVKKL